MFLVGIADSCFVIVINPIYNNFTNDNEFLTGILFTVFTLMMFFSAPVWGWLSDKFGRKRMKILTRPLTIIGVILLFLTYRGFIPYVDDSAFSFLGSLFFLFVIISTIFRGMGSISDNINHQMLVAESADKSKNGKGFTFGLMAFLYFSGTIVGSLIVNFTDLELHQYLIITVCILTLDWVLNLVFVSETHHPHENSKEKMTLPQIWRGIFKNSKIKAAMIFLTLDVFVWGISGSVYKVGLDSDFGVTVNDFAMMQLVFSISMMVFQIPAGKITDKFGIKKVLIFSISFGLIIFPLFIITSFIWDAGFQFILIPALIISQILWAATASTFIPSEWMILTDLDESRKAESHGIVSFVRGFGAIPTGIIGGFLIFDVHFIAPFILSTVGIIFELWFIIKHGHKFEIIADQKPKEIHIKPSGESVSEIELTEI